MSITIARGAIRKGVEVVIVQLIDEDEEQLPDAGLLGCVKIKVDPEGSKKKDLITNIAEALFSSQNTKQTYSETPYSSCYSSRRRKHSPIATAV